MGGSKQKRLAVQMGDQSTSTGQQRRASCCRPLLRCWQQTMLRLPPKLQRLLASAQKLGDPGVAEGKQTYPDYSSIAAPAHENVEKDRVHLMVSLCISAMYRRNQNARHQSCSGSKDVLLGHPGEAGCTWQAWDDLSAIYILWAYEVETLGYIWYKNAVLRHC